MKLIVVITIIRVLITERRTVSITGEVIIVITYNNNHLYSEHEGNKKIFIIKGYMRFTTCKQRGVFRDIFRVQSSWGGAIFS